MKLRSAQLLAFFPHFSVVSSSLLVFATCHVVLKLLILQLGLYMESNEWFEI